MADGTEIFEQDASGLPHGNAINPVFGGARSGENMNLMDKLVEALTQAGGGKFFDLGDLESGGNKAQEAIVQALVGTLFGNVTADMQYERDQRALDDAQTRQAEAQKAKRTRASGFLTGKDAEDPNKAAAVDYSGLLDYDIRPKPANRSAGNAAARVGYGVDGPQVSSQVGRENLGPSSVSKFDQNLNTMRQQRAGQ